MSNTLFFDGLILYKVWTVGFLGFHIEWIIYTLPAIAVFAFLIRLLYNKSVLHQNKL
jgi:hypothetical protein